MSKDGLITLVKGEDFISHSNLLNGFYILLCGFVDLVCITMKFNIFLKLNVRVVQKYWLFTTQHLMRSGCDRALTAIWYTRFITCLFKSSITSNKDDFTVMVDG